MAKKVIKKVLKKEAPEEVATNQKPIITEDGKGTQKGVVSE